MGHPLFRVWRCMEPDAGWQWNSRDFLCMVDRISGEQSQTIRKHIGNFRTCLWQSLYWIMNNKMIEGKFMVFWLIKYPKSMEKTWHDMKGIPLICKTTIDIPVILQIEKSRTVYVYNEDEDGDREIIYRPYFRDSDSRKKRN